MNTLGSLGSDDDDLTPDQRKETEIIKKNRVKLTEYIHDVTTLFPFMKERDVFTKSDCELVKSETTASLRVDRFIDILLTKGPRAIGVFHESLSHHCTHLFNYLCKIFIEAGIELPLERQTVHTVYDSQDDSPTTSSYGGAGWRRVHSRRVKQSLDMLTSQIEKIQGERDSFRSILNHREQEMEELFRSKMEMEAMKEALSLDEASRAVLGLKNERDKIQNEYEKLDAEYMLTSLELCAARDRIQKLSCQLEQYEQALTVNTEEKENLQTQLNILNGQLQRHERHGERMRLYRAANNGQVNVSKLLDTMRDLKLERQQALEELEDVRSENDKLKKTVHSQFSVESVTSRSTSFLIGTMSSGYRTGTETGDGCYHSPCNVSQETWSHPTEGVNQDGPFQSHLNQFEVDVEAGHDGLTLELGVYVTSIEQSSSFERAGVQCGDIIVQVNSINISEDPSPLDLVKRILDSASKVNLALMRSGGQGKTPAMPVTQTSIQLNTYDTSDEEPCSLHRPSRLKLSPSPTRHRTPTGSANENTSPIQGHDPGRRGNRLLPGHGQPPARSISAPSSPRNKATVHLTPYRNMHFFHSDHSDEDSSDSPMGSPIRCVHGTQLTSNPYVNCYVPFQSGNGNIRQKPATEPGSNCTLNGRQLFNMSPVSAPPWKDTQSTSLPHTFVDRVNCGGGGGGGGVNTAPPPRKLSDVPRPRSKSPFNAIMRPWRRNGLHRRSMSDKDLPTVSNTIWYD